MPRPTKPVLTPAEAVRFARKVAAITQQELADLCGVRVGQISRIERGKDQPSAELALRIAKAVFIGADEILPDLPWEAATTSKRPRKNNSENLPK